jgi:hypothetical protein
VFFPLAIIWAAKVFAFNSYFFPKLSFEFAKCSFGVSGELSNFTFILSNMQLKPSSTITLLQAIALSFGGLLCSAPGCDPDCPDQQGNYVFLITKEKRDTTNSIMLYHRVDVPEKGVVLNGPTNNLYLDPASDHTTFLLHDTSTVDTIVIRYNAEIQYQDPNCGVQYNISDLKAETTLTHRLEVMDPYLRIWKLTVYK